MKEKNKLSITILCDYLIILSLVYRFIYLLMYTWLTNFENIRWFSFILILIFLFLMFKNVLRDDINKYKQL